MTPFAIRKRIRSLLHEARDFVSELQALSRGDVAPVAPKAPTVSTTPTTQEHNWEMSTPAELVDHIVSHHHEGLRRELPKLIRVAKQIEREQSKHPAAPRGLTDTLTTLSSELEGHMQSEEGTLFPLLTGGTRSGSVELQIRMMARDHDDHAKQLEQIRKQTSNLTAPQDASEEWTKLYSDLTALEADLREHIYLEDSILFARVTNN